MGLEDSNLTACTETQRTEALKRFRLIRPFLEDGVPLIRLTTHTHLPVRTLRRWVQRYRAHGLLGLVHSRRSDQGMRRSVSPHLQQVIEGLALQKPRRTIATIHREVARVCQEQGWKTPSYSTVERIVQHLDPALMTFAHQGSKVYREEFDLIYRHQADAPNEMWQADHSLLPIFVLNEQGKPTKPWLTIILLTFTRY